MNIHINRTEESTLEEIVKMLKTLSIEEQKEMQSFIHGMIFAKNSSQSKSA